MSAAPVVDPDKSAGTDATPAVCMVDARDAAVGTRLVDGTAAAVAVTAVVEGAVVPPAAAACRAAALLGNCGAGMGVRDETRVETGSPAAAMLLLRGAAV